MRRHSAPIVVAVVVATSVPSLCRCRRRRRDQRHRNCDVVLRHDISTFTRVHDWKWKNPRTPIPTDVISLAHMTMSRFGSLTIMRTHIMIMSRFSSMTVDAHDRRFNTQQDNTHVIVMSRFSSFCAYPLDDTSGASSCGNYCYDQYRASF